MSKKIPLILVLLILTGCQSMQITTPNIESSSTSSILIFREPAFNGGGGSLYFGENGKTYASLNNSEYAELKVSSGTHNFFVTARGAQDFNFSVTLKPNEKICVKSYADPTNYAKVFVPILMNLTSLFKAEVVACPNLEELKYYSKSSI